MLDINPATQEKIILAGTQDVSFKYYKKLDNFLKELDDKSVETKNYVKYKSYFKHENFFQHILTDTLTEDILKNLIAENCNINMVSRRGNTPLVYAYKKRKNNSIKLLLDNDADQTVYEDGYYVGEFIDNGRTILDLRAKIIILQYCSCSVKDKARIMLYN